MSEISFLTVYKLEKETEDIKRPPTPTPPPNKRGREGRRKEGRKTGKISHYLLKK
jgi:hypothetical protein